MERDETTGRECGRTVRVADQRIRRRIRGEVVQVHRRGRFGSRPSRRHQRRRNVSRRVDVVRGGTGDRAVRPPRARRGFAVVGRGENVFTGRARQVTNLGSYAEVIVELANGMTVLAETESFPSIQNGDDVYIQFDPEDVIAL
ncbi:TOBE domain-containing protein [Haloplanus sp. GCM10025708]|uniref:TOBE domain-containing protein n=1 Tax=Haloplanus sp. GCM10025708 TaxID=3252679 RepID=UPI00361DD96B